MVFPPPSGVGLERLVIVDFDGTLARGTWPSAHIGEPIPNGVKLLMYYYNMGCEIRIFTARPRSHAAQIWHWLRENNLEQYIYDVITDKPKAGLYIDDKAWRFEG